MSCINFKATKKNNRWRENIGEITQKDNEMTFFGVDTESSVNTLLQNNITLLDWIRKSKGFPYFVGRWINGHDPLTKDEIDYIKSIGSNVIPIIRPEDSLSYDALSEKTVSILKELNFEKGTVVFLSIGSNDMPSECLIAFAKGIIDEGYIPGFYANTDSYYEFDHQFSIAYQDDETTMKKCKIWALSPEMEEFFETRTSHNPQPDFWGPFAPSCLSKEQISFWQYGKKCHPINTYKGDRADFNLNFTIEPGDIFSVCETRVLNYNFAKEKNYNFAVCVTDGENIETLNLNCDFIKAKSNSLLVNDKVYAKNINSSHNILQFVICKNNDVFSAKNIVAEGNALIKFTFISKESSRVFHFEKIISLEECELLKDIITNSAVTENEEEIRKISAQETWFAKFIIHNTFNNDNGGKANSEQNDSIVENYMYNTHEDIFASEIINVSKMRSSISGDTYNIFATIPQYAVKRSGSEYCTIKDAYGRPATAYYKDTLLDYDGCYKSRIAIWSLNPSITSAQNADRLVEFTYQKAYNAFVYYYPSTDKIKVIYCDNDQTYVVTSNTQISLNLVGCHTAYVDKCSFEVCLGGNNTGNVDFLDDALSALGYATSNIKVLGKLVSVVSNIYAGFSFLNEVADAITNYNYSKATHEYSFYPECNLVTKQVGSTFEPVLGYKNSLLKIRATLDNVTIYPNSAVFCQVKTKVLSTFAGNNETIYVGGSIVLQ